MTPALLEKWLSASAGDRAVALVTHLGTGDQALILKDGIEGSLFLTTNDKSAIQAILSSHQSQMVELQCGSVFVEIWQKPLRLIVIGAVHVSQFLTPMARLVGYETFIIDPRTSFATKERFPQDTLITEWPDIALATIGLDRRSALVTLTHDAKLDDPALLAGLGSEAFYIGALGSMRSHAKRIDRLIAAGASHQQIDRIHGPVGLAIGSVSPAEIAVSIMAEITAILRHSKLGWRPATPP